MRKGVEEEEVINGRKREKEDKEEDQSLIGRNPANLDSMHKSRPPRIRYIKLAA